MHKINEMKSSHINKQQKEIYNLKMKEIEQANKFFTFGKEYRDNIHSNHEGDGDNDESDLSESFDYYKVLFELFGVPFPSINVRILKKIYIYIYIYIIFYLFF